MHSIDEILLFVKDTYGVTLTPDEPVITTVRNRVYKAQELTPELFQEYAAYENDAPPELLVGIARRNIKKTPTLWNFVPKASNVLSLCGNTASALYMEMAKTLDAPSAISTTERTHMLCYCMNKDKRLLEHTSNFQLKKKSLVEIVEKHWAQAGNMQDDMTLLLYEPIIQGRLSFKTLSPLIVRTIRQGNIQDLTGVRHLMALALAYPQLKGAIAESLILNRHHIFNGATHLHDLMTSFWSGYEPASIEWQRCAAALCITIEPHRVDALGKMAAATWPDAWQNMSTKCHVYTDICGIRIQEESKAIDSILHQSTQPVKQYGLPDLDDTTYNLNTSY